MKTQDLNQQELNETNGGSLLGNGLLGNDSNMIKAIDQGYAHAANTDDSGRTSSNDVSFGSGSLLESLDM